MNGTTIELTDDQMHVLEENRGFVQGSSYVVISSETYRRMMGVERDEDLAESLAAIERGLADIEAGRVRPLDEFVTEFKAQHRISG